MADYIPPSGDNVVLNFKDLATGSTELNFGAESGENSAVLDVVIDTRFLTDIDANYTWINSLDALIDTGFIAEITATYADNTAVLDAVINTSLISQIDALFDINFILGVSGYHGFGQQQAATRLIATEASWAKPTLKAYNSAFIFEQGLTLSNAASIGFDNTLAIAFTRYFNKPNCKRVIAQ